MKQKIDHYHTDFKPDNSPSLIYRGGHYAPHAGSNSKLKTLKVSSADAKINNFSGLMDGQERR